VSAKKNRNQQASSRTNGEDLKRALAWVLNDSIFKKVSLHGNVSWTPMALVQLAVFWVWCPDNSLVAAANSAIGLVWLMYGSVPLESYQALTKALKRYSCQLLPLMWCRLHSLMEQCDEEKWRVGMWLALAMDGSRVSVPRTEKNEERFCKPRRKKGKSGKKKKRSRSANKRRSKGGKKSHYNPQPVGPQMWLTMIWHIGLNLPWAWKIGPSYSSERAHVLELLEEQEFPSHTLFCGDAGFVGYDFWRQIAAHYHFLVRVGANVRLLKRLGYVRERAGIVYCWPDAASKKRLPPLVLRLLHFNDGRGDVYLVTNVLDSRELSDAQASEIYRRRWGIELQFRSFKQTFERSKLRSRSPDCAEIELHWSFIGLWIIQLLALKERTELGEPDEHTSVATAIRIIRHMVNNHTAVRPARESLRKQLAEATTDNYQRTSKKKSRNYPRRKEEPSAGKPIIHVASRSHKDKLNQIQELANAI
jgi:hypothetical protein